MTPYFQKNDITIYHGDLRGIVPSLSLQFDHVVTDSPYGLGFMEKDWDQAVPGPEYWRAIYKACKPGALLLAFGGTRTWHRLACAIEDAEWEIRDCLMWLYGQGFPKTPDVGKLIDKAKGAVREVIGPAIYGDGHIQHNSAKRNQSGRYNFTLRDGVDPDPMVTAPATDLAKAWTGWALALKPAWEPIVLAMKAMEGTIAHNAETYGVAGMNIDACRIKTDEVFHVPQSDPSKREGIVGTNLGITRSNKEAFQAAQRESIAKTQKLGRYPANLILDEESAQLLDEQTGTLTSGSNNVRTKPGDGYHGGLGKAGDVQVSYGDSGGASRFFYCPKASKRERGEGNDHPTVKPLALMKYLLTLLSTPTGGLILDPFAGSGTTLLAAASLGRPCVGIELEEHYCEIIARRLEATNA